MNIRRNEKCSMKLNDQLELDIATKEIQKRRIYLGYTVDISHIYKFRIAVNWHGVLIKTKKDHPDYTSILECDNEEVADLVLNAVKKAVKRRAYIVPEFDPLGSYEVQKIRISLWISAVERLLGYEKSQEFRIIDSNFKLH